MSAPTCPECGQGKCRNCTGEALEADGSMLVPCTCPDPLHVDEGPKRRLYRLLVGSASIGATAHEAHEVTGIRQAGQHLAALVAEGRAMRLSETRRGWPVFVFALDVQGRQIAAERETDRG